MPNDVKAAGKAVRCVYCGHFYDPDKEAHKPVEVEETRGMMTIRYTQACKVEAKK